MLVSAVVLMTAAPSAAYAQCWGALSAITSVIGTVNTAFLPSGSAFLSSPRSAPDQQGGGVWTRTVGGTVDTKANTNFTGLFAVAQAGGPTLSLPVNTSCQTTAKQNFIGFEVGHDIAALNTANSDMNWHFGVLAGYVGAKVDSPPVFDGGLSGNFEVPSAGLYSAFAMGAFSADVQGRLYSLQAESVGQRLDASGYSLASNIAYRFDLPGRWTLEPSVGGIFSRTSVDQLGLADVSQTLIVPVAGLPPIPPGTSPLAIVSGTMQVHDVDSLLGRATVKLATILPLPGGRIVAYPFVTASVFHEFEGDATAALVATGAIPGVIGFQGSGNFTTGGIGTYGQFGAGSTFQLPDTGWVGFARVDYRTGENIQGVIGSAGLRYQFESSRHLAETRPRRPQMAVKARPAEGYDWTGPYAGLSSGSTWGRTHWAFQGATVDPDYAGILVGGQAGYNFQRGRFVGGIEADAGWSNARGAAACPDQPIFLSCLDDVGALGSVTGRFGYTWGRALLYAKGGWAFGEVSAGRSLNFVHPGIQVDVPGGISQSTHWESGWTTGAGMEFAVTDMWSAKAEYMHYAFPQDAFTAGQSVTANAATAGDTVRIGVNYHFLPQ
ncbi:MAG: autotransporter domain-containing protein [Bradyrhizobiaceae bacterium]|nr:autotransporter domain-containing protein [Bradyrhizobiaceae bacterium]